MQSRSHNEAAYDHRTQRSIHEAITGTGTHRDKIDRLVAVVEELGFPPPEPLRPLPEIIDRDVHLVCWMALIPK
jgi:hypothetical protein